MKAKGLRVGERVFHQGEWWTVLGVGPDDGSFTLRHTGDGHEAVIYHRDRVWVREPSRFERLRPPSSPKKGKHRHQWKLVADGRGRLCTVCGRGDVKTEKGWRRAT